MFSVCLGAYPQHPQTDFETHLYCGVYRQWVPFYCSVYMYITVCFFIHLLIGI